MTNVESAGAQTINEATASEARREALQAVLAVMRAEAEEARKSLEKQLAEADQARKALEAQLATLENSVAEQRTASAAERDALEARLASVTADSERQLRDLKASLQESRRRATLLESDLHQLKEERLALHAEISASRDRRKEAARVIAERDAEIQARYRELAALQLHILQSSWSSRLNRLWRRLSGGGSRAIRAASRPALR